MLCMSVRINVRTCEVVEMQLFTYLLLLYLISESELPTKYIYIYILVNITENIDLIQCMQFSENVYFATPSNI